MAFLHIVNLFFLQKACFCILLRAEASRMLKNETFELATCKLKFKKMHGFKLVQLVSVSFKKIIFGEHWCFDCGTSNKLSWSKCNCNYKKPFCSDKAKDKKI